MSRSLPQAKHLVSQSLPLFHLQRRGFAAASDVSARVGQGKFEEKPVSRDGQEACSAWVPDPETGYYRPINCTPKIDPVELRKMLLKHNTRPSN
ncbi:late embryogenesis abundant protein Lea5-like [Vicia villosa]|uniref:late embryogenesis abundant protein Lea5-like n=1 Tax=Vicia villosa TaxID=3911 RepID=UPI00273AD267|nr:late embryogenesis abundant protein Lea5-like [Vicia villosa]